MKLEYILYVSEKDYFGREIITNSLQNVIAIIESENNNNCYIRLEVKRKNKKNWRVLFKPVENNKREIEACNNMKLTNRIFKVKYDIRI